MANKKENSFIKNFIVLGFGSFLYLIVGVIGTPIITRLVDPSEYGSMSMFTIYGSIGLMLCGLGLDQSFVRYFYHNDDISYKRKLLRECFLIPVLVLLVVSSFLCIGVFAGNSFGILHQSMGELIALELYVFVLILHRYAILVLRLRYHTKEYSAVNIIQKILYIVFTIVLVFFIKGYYYAILIVATILSNALASLIGILKEKEVWSFKKEKELAVPLKELLTYSIPIMVSSGITMIFNALDKFSIDFYCTRADVGVYTSAMNLMAVFNIIRTSFNALWMPSAVEHFEKNNGDKSFYQKGNAFISIFMLSFGAALILFKDVFVLLLGNKYQAASQIIPYLMFEPIMYTISETTATGIVVQKKSKYQMVVAGVSCGVNFIGNITLTPMLGPMGAAISTGVSYVVFFTLRTYLANKVFYVKYKLKEFYVAVILLFVYAVYGSMNRFNVVQVGSFLGFIVLLVVLYRNDVREGGLYIRAKMKRRNNTTR